MKDKTFEADPRAGQELFKRMEKELSNVMTDRFQAGGNPRDVAIGFLSSFAAFIGRNAGMTASRALFTETLKILKRVGH